MKSLLVAGAAAVDVTPRDSQFLFGYPHVPRMSTGVHDPLWSSALFLNDGRTSVLLIGCDVIFVDRALTARARQRIEQETQVPAECVLISASHTHSGPVTVDMLSNRGDAVVPPADPAYLQHLEDGIVAAARRAVAAAFPARLEFAVADASCVGGNRHDPHGPSDSAAPILAVWDERSGAIAALMTVCAMHPTVLHEDSTCVSGDFPGMTRQYLQQRVLRRPLPVIYHPGACGNLSPRHVTRANTLDEARRLGTALGRAIESALDLAEPLPDSTLRVNTERVELPLRAFPDPVAAARQAAEAAAELADLRSRRAKPPAIRTAECRWFGAEETLTLSRIAADKELLATALAATMPAEIMLIEIGPLQFVAWPGEVFVEFALELRARHPRAYVLSLANGELQGYLVTDEAVRQGTYEALNALFASPVSGQLLVEASCRLISRA